MLRKLRNWLITLANSRSALWVLAAVSFTESSIFPIPPDIILVPVALARPDSAWRIAVICTLASVIGGLFGYAIGYLLFDGLGFWVIEVYHLQQIMDNLHSAIQTNALWIILVKGITPVPFKLVAIACGFAKVNIILFLFASFITRGTRFFIIVALLQRLGPSAESLIKRYVAQATIGIILIVVFSTLIASQLT
jgi:membrane protein YqaA with SNARE-associated domain